MIRRLLKKSERGQAIILIAVAFVGLIAMVGLMTDGGMMLIEYARLKRGIDAASVAAAQQFRKDFQGSDLVAAATNFLMLNQSDAVDVVVSMCDPTGTYGGVPAHDAALCPASGQPQRKLVRVTATRFVTFGFLRVIGINGTTISATSVGEAASIDLILLMDTSLSMAYGTSGTTVGAEYPGDNPATCNLVANAGPGHNSNSGACQPLDNIKSVARQFVSTFLFFPYDRVAIVTMTSQSPGGTRDPVLIPFSDSLTAIDATLANIKVYEPPACVKDASNPSQWISPSIGNCLEYNSSGVNIGVNSPILRGGADLNEATLADNIKDPTTIGSSNVGGALILANNAFIASGRQDGFWVVIALAGGPANATSTDDPTNYPYGFCPQSTWNAPNTPRCRDSDLAANGITPLITRHSRGNPNAIPPVPIDTNYDADDYARDAADDLANPETGNGITIFTIGLGTAQGETNSLRNSTIGLPTSGENLLVYVAECAGDVYTSETNLFNAQCPRTAVDPFRTRDANHGQYYYAEDPTLDLGPIFSAIAGNIFTRISQ